jgi:hypothetical protein
VAKSIDNVNQALKILKTNSEPLFLIETCSMISIEETEKIHKVLVDTFGGTHGIRDLNTFLTMSKSDIWRRSVALALRVSRPVARELLDYKTA